MIFVSAARPGAAPAGADRETAADTDRDQTAADSRGQPEGRNLVGAYQAAVRELEALVQDETVPAEELRASLESRLFAVRVPKEMLNEHLKAVVSLRQNSGQPSAQEYRQAAAASLAQLRRAADSWPEI
ncbi:MAG: hypothetical protein UY92_C0013G0029 [Candidatus Magasanikbacteria bacterium GW2011_GWA2_56_11]|uniref:Uncharacterized protein n=1 Tax=Candidatus Magasanikbacteria bacterium GW2011_GWA2_56_11 TaxID=1619044 RepID=A0A0G1YF60_9BACT|nr:MAG: hypothetical protein UY92_C0013G0029 [Candidatus Magasanikbacteria bacterium GW2011_GWA2_56_11]